MKMRLTLNIPGAQSWYLLNSWEPQEIGLCQMQNQCILYFCSILNDKSLNMIQELVYPDYSLVKIKNWRRFLLGLVWRSFVKFPHQQNDQENLIVALFNVFRNWFDFDCLFRMSVCYWGLCGFLLVLCRVEAV